VSSTTLRASASPAGIPLDEDEQYYANIGDLWGRGWSVIPLERGGKKPAITSWLEYQKRPATFVELDAWFSRRLLNVGVVTGHVSGVFVLDADTAEAIAWADANLPPTDMRVRTAKGLHLYYPLSADSTMKNKTRIKVGSGGRIGIDVRAQGGYVVGPGSVHPCGAVYTREGAGWGRL
jgi:putative DNA primase/helicase